MQVQRIQNNNFNSPNFGALKISKAKSWNEEVLYEFVTNKEVRKFVKIMHNMGKDVQASFCRYPLPKSHKIELSGTNEFINLPFYEMSSNKMNAFSAKEALANYNRMLIEKKDKKILSENLFKKAMEIVDDFNKSLEIKETKQTLKKTAQKEKQLKWWQIWK